MNNYHEEDLKDPEKMMVRPKDVKKNASFHYCKWAAQEWEASFYANTEQHHQSRDFTISQMMNNPAWFKIKGPKIDKRIVERENKARDNKPKRGKRKVVA